MDIFENFKWTSFKRMMLSAAEKNSVIGVSLPLGCDNVMVSILVSITKLLHMR